MHYHQFHLLPKVAPTQPVIDSLVELHVSADLLMRDEIISKGAWIPGERRETPSDLELLLPDRDGGDFLMRVSFDNNEKGFKFKSLSWWPSRGAVWQPNQIGNWRINEFNGIVRLDYSW
jgi:hypothetical protein